ncbi:Esterase FE4 [Orchesella cincta]|uniref:Carboxylic ester hydrolase n=1 Tax=Orchesella cincta TaxID=48709 RepID=A0A1D2MRG5_ORCCI|nr:Esterase FE4 [Orchesella cincta]
MVLVLGAFLLNALCAIVPCPPVYDPPEPVPIPTFVKIPILKSPYVVNTQSGKVEGFPMKTIRARDIIAFTGIPYAEPPIKNLQYRDPVPKKRWSGILKATKLPSDCLQIDGMQSLRIVGSVNCLYLSVYTPALPSADSMTNRSVIIMIHGGSFAFGSGSMYGPAYLLEKDVVLVTFNYRLSSFGFLSTGDDAASGNWALKDQNLVLKWTRANIQSFGGDPNNIVLLGQSAGAVSVHLHMMSKQSQGLFRAGVSQSGNAFSFWGVRQNSIDFTYRLANSLKCPVNDTHALVECMRNVDPFLIAYHEATLPDYKVFPGVFFGPIVEPASETAFLTERPEKLYEDGLVAKIPWINGFLAGEGNGVSFLTYLYPFVMREVDARWSELGPKILDLKGETRYTSKTAAYIKHFYFGNHPINFYTRNRLTQMVGDRLIVAAVHKGLQYHSKIAPTYGYFFNYTGRYGTASIYGLKNEDWGISHDDDLIYLFNSTTYQALKVGEREYDFSEFLINVWTNFASTGVPTYVTDNRIVIPFWKPVNASSNDMQVAVLIENYPKMIDIPYRNRIKFWEKLNLVSNSYVNKFPMGISKNASENGTGTEKLTAQEATNPNLKVPLTGYMRQHHQSFIE